MGDASSQVLPQKLYFRIGEVAELVGVEPHVLRYWEREFRTIRPTKSAKGQRVYSRRDVENLMRVHQLLYRDGFTIAGAKKRLRVDDDSEPPASAPTTSSGPAKAPAGPSERRVAPSEIAKACAQLAAMRDEIEAFLAGLEPAPVGTKGADRAHDHAKK